MRKGVLLRFLRDAAADAGVLRGNDNIQLSENVKNLNVSYYLFRKQLHYLPRLFFDSLNSSAKKPQTNKNRKTAVAGQFYPGSKKELKKDLDELFESFDCG